MKIKLLILLPICLLIMMIAFGCGPKPIKPASVLETPENHYSQGMREFDRGNFNNAEGEFTKAVQLNPNFAEGYSGIGLVWAARGDFKKAHEFADKGLGKNGNSLDARVIKGRIYVAERKGDNWVEDAVKEFDKASKINPNSDKPLYYKGIAYKNAYMFRESEGVFSQVVGMKGDFAKDANEEWSLVQKIVRAAPGTKIGAKIALIKEIDRADLAVLFIEELKLLEIFEKKRPQEYDTGFKAPDDPTKMQTSETTFMADATDVDTHWAKNWINDIVKAKGMDVFPDHTFRPDDKITRANYAQLIQNILIMATSDETLATKYIGTQSRFPDVNPSHFAYNAICLTVDRGIMSADKMTGAFNMNTTVSGADALLIIRDFQNALRMTF
ncbi:MAG TPA: S-layer homology domain-containing protein [bacterium]|nr:S-layer homology domain-containing protein [bacterium]HPN45419.1 S-layer homology domain-containing protein [bacterium]